MSSSFPESYDDNPEEIRELYLAAEMELKEIVEGFTHTYVNNLMREGGKSKREHFWDDDDCEDGGEEEAMDEEYFARPLSGLRGNSSSIAEEEVPIFAMEVTALFPPPSPKFPFPFSSPHFLARKQVSTRHL